MTPITEPDRSPASSQPRSQTRRRRWVVVSWCDLVSALLVAAVAVWGTIGLPTGSRFIALAAAAVLIAVVCSRLCLDPRWYRPDPRQRRLARVLRDLAGPLAVLGCLLVALPAPWAAGERTVVVLISLIPIATLALTVDQDSTLRCVVEMVRTESQDGRQSVLDELHGSLSANLRLLEQACLELRPSSPRLYELAVGASSRLRETLSLADPRLDSVAEPETLGALLRTLAMAVGARGDLTVRIDCLADTDRDLVRLVLNDVVRELLAGGAGHVLATVDNDHDGFVRVAVSGDGLAQGAVLSRLDPLRERLSAADGSIAYEAGDERGTRRHMVVARWPPAPGTG